MVEINKLQSIPKVVFSIVFGFFTILMIRITYPIANFILGLFNTGIWKVVSVMVFWLIIIFCVMVLPWILIFSPPKQEVTQ